MWQQGQHVRWVWGSWYSHSLFVVGGIIRYNLVGFRDEVKRERGVFNSFHEVLEFVRKEAAELCPEGKDKRADAQIVGDDVADGLEDVVEHQYAVYRVRRLNSKRVSPASVIPTGGMHVRR
jgi:hypothetical protein